jgi:putative ABC transport system ATP-binding protein
MITLEGVHKVYGREPGAVHALRGIDLRVQDGESVAIMGPSGCGKSTLLHIMGCLDRPTRGACLIDGANVAECDDWRLSQLRGRAIGFVFQMFHLLAHCDVLENTMLPFVYSGVPWREGRARAREALGRVGLQHRMGHLPDQLSGGEKQRVAVARALVMRPRILLADEPTGNLDSATSHELLSLFEMLGREGMTVVIVTHAAGVAQRCGRIVRLGDGAIAGEGAAS